jgi:hypothetical protein
VAAVKKKLAAQRQFVAELDGKTVVVLQGARFPATHAVVEQHPEHFAAKKADV